MRDRQHLHKNQGSRAQLLQQQKTSNYVPNQQDSNCEAVNKKGCTRCSKFLTHPAAWLMKLHAAKCKKQGHYISQCVNESQIWQQYEHIKSMRNPIPRHNRDNDLHTARITNGLLLNGKPVQFKIDTGADITAISEEYSRNWMESL